MNPPEVPPTPPTPYSSSEPPAVPPVPSSSYAPPMQQPAYSYQVTPPASNNIAIVSLVLSAVGTTGICCCPMLVTSIAGVICGHIGLSRARSLGGLGKVPALIGTILGYLAILLSAVYLAVAFTSPEAQKAIEEFQKEFKKSMQEAQQKQQNTTQEHGQH